MACSGPPARPDGRTAPQLPPQRAGRPPPGRTPRRAARRRAPTASIRASSNFALCLCAALLLAPAHAASAAEIAALQSIYSATGGASWTTSTGWADATDPCTAGWHGVTCTSTAVTALDLSSNNLAGELPDVFADLSSLTTVTLTGNAGLTGALPDSLWQLSSVTQLLFDSCGVTGSIPASVSVPSLFYLNFQDTPVSGELPEALYDVNYVYATSSALTGSLPTTLCDPTVGLVSLWLSGTSITGTIPTEIGNCNYLGSLKVGSTGVTGTIPSELGSAGLSYNGLSNLDFSYTALSGELPSELGQDTLVYFQAQGSAFTGTVPGALGGPVLSLFYAQDNALTGQLPAALFSSSPAMTAISVENNALSGTVPTEIGQAAALGTVELGGNAALGGPLPTELGSLAASLTFLDIQDCALSGTLPTELGLLTSLTNLQLSDNALTGSVLPAELGQLTALLVLYLGGNAGLVGTLPTEIGLLTSLAQLYVEDCSLTGSVPTEIGLINQAPYYGYISASGNQFTGQLPNEAVATTYLAEALWQDNLLTGPLPTAYSAYLTTLNLGYNDFGSSVPTEIGTAISLNNLYVEHGTFTGDLPTELGLLSGLQVLYMEESQITGLPAELANCPSFWAIWAENAQLSGRIPAGLGTNTNLYYIMADYNSLSKSIPDDIVSPYFVGLSATDNALTGTVPPELGGSTVVELRLSGNSFTGSLAPELFSGASSLQSLQISGSALTGTLPTEMGLASLLWYVDLGENALTGSLPTELGACSSLGALLVNDNALTGPIPSELGNTAMSDFYAWSNALTHLPDELTALPTLYTLQVYGNEALAGSLAPASMATAADLTYINVDDCALTGSLPTELGLTSLQQLLAARNSLTGSLPTEMADSTGGLLAYVSVSGNVAMTGTVPSELGTCSALAALHASDTGIGGQLPNLCLSSALVELELNNAALTGSIPPTLSGCTGISTLDLGSNSLAHGIPSSALAAMPNLWELDLSANQLTGTIGSFPAALSALSTVLLSNNALTGTLHEAWGELSSLFNLDVGVNLELSGQLPDFSNSPTYLDFTSCDFTGTLPALSFNNNLLFFQAAGNELTGTITDDFSSAVLPSLNLLYLADNSLTGTVPSGLASLPIADLDLSSNDLTGTLPNDVFVQTELAYLKVQNNLLTGPLPDLGATPLKMQYTDLSYNQFNGSLTAGHFSGANFMQTLELSGNPLQGTLPSEVGLLGGKLYNLYASYTGLTGSLPSELGNVGTLQRLLVVSNSLTGTVPSELGALEDLVYLHLGTNSFTGTLPPEWSGMTSLQYMYLSSNEFSGTIPAEYADLPNLIDLFVGDNRMAGFHDPSITVLGALIYDSPQFVIQDAQLAALEAIYDATGPWTDSTNWGGALPCHQGSEWRGVTCDYLGNVMRLDLFNNSLQGVLPDQAADLTELRYVDVSGSANALYCPLPWDADAVHITGDCTLLETTLERQPASYSNESVFGEAFAFSTVPEGLDVEVMLDDSGNWTFDWAALELADGYHSVQCRAVLAAGDPDPSPAEHAWVVDTVAPVTYVLSAPAPITAANASEVALGVSEGGCTLDSRLDGGAWTTTVETADSGVFVPPSTDVVAQPDELTTSTSALFELASDAGADAAFEASVDGGDWALLAGAELQLDGLAQGWHLCLFRALDAAGVLDETPASVMWFVAAQDAPPVVAIEATPSAEDELTVAKFELSLERNGHQDCVYEWDVDDGASAAATTTLDAVSVGPLEVGDHVFVVRAVCGAVASAPANHTWAVVPPPAQSLTVDASDLPDGLHSVDVDVVDAAGNRGARLTYEWTVDRTPPVTVAERAPPALTASPRVTARFSCVDEHDCVFDDSTGGTSYDGRVVLDGLPDGRLELTVRARDAANNTDAAGGLAYNVTVDTTPPVLSVARRPDAVTSVRYAAAALEIECDDATTGCAVALSPDLSPTAPLADGEYNVTATGVDDANNTAAPLWVAWRVDGTPPTTLLASAPPAVSAARDTPLALDCDDASPPCGFLVYVDDLPPVWGNSCVADAGPHHVVVRAVDQANNTDPEGVEFDLTVDVDPPQTLITLAPPALGNDPDVDFAFDCADDQSPLCTYEVALDGASPPVYDGLADGTHVLTVRALDWANNTGNVVTYSFVVDTVAPAASFASTPGAVSASRDLYFAVDCDDANCSLSYSTGDGWVAFEAAFALEGLPDGELTVAVVTADPAGNEAAAIEWTTHVDATAPNATLVEYPAAYSSDASPAFAYGCADGAGVYGCEFDDGDPDLADLADGAHALAVRATDAAGNVGPYLEYEWVVDTEPPVTLLLSPVASPTNDPSPEFDVGCEDASPCTFENDANYPLADGLHSVTVWAVDAAGNADTATRLNLTVEVDTVPPATTLLAAPGALTNDPTPFLAVACSGGVWVDDWFSPSANLSLPTALADGEHTLLVRAADAANNTDPVGVNVTFVVDTAAPDTQVADAPAVLGASSLTLEVACGDGEGACAFAVVVDGGAETVHAAPVAAIELAGLVDELHAFDVRAVDAAGNVDPAGVQWTTLVDTTAPQLFAQPPGDYVSTETSQVSFAVVDALPTACDADGEPLDGGAASFSVTAAADGEQRVALRCVDDVGNAATVNVTWVLDRSEPDIAVDAAPAALGNDGAFAVAFAVADFTPTTVACVLYLDGALESSGACASPWSFAGAADGVYSLQIVATDSVGLSGNATAKWELDATAPALAFDEDLAPRAVTGDTSAVFAVECLQAAAGGDSCGGGGGDDDDAALVADEGCAVRFALDGAAEMSALEGSSVQLSALADGYHTILFEGEDLAGNVASLEYSWLVSEEVSPVAVQAPPALPLAHDVVSFVVGADADDVEFEALWDGSPDGEWASEGVFANYSSSSDGDYTEATGVISGAGVGEHTVQVRVIGYSEVVFFTWEVGECETTGQQRVVDAADDTLSCVDCPIGVSCVNGLASLDSGWWSDADLDDVRDVELYECPVPESCTGDINATCATGYAGLLCAECDAGYAMSFGSCTACPAERAGATTLLVFLLLLLAALVALACRYSDRMVQSGSLKTVMSFVHFMSAIIAFDAPWPELMVDLINAVGFIGNFDLFSVTSFSCADVQLDFYARWTITMMLPLVIIAVIVAYYSLRRGISGPDRKTCKVRNSVLVVLFAYPGVSGQLVQFFNCRMINDQWYFVADLTLHCYDATWYATMPFAFIVTSLYVFGVPLTCVYWLRKHKHELDSAEARKTLGLLYLSYKPSDLYHEVINLCFKMLLWIVAVFAGRGSSLQLGGGLTFTLFFLTYHCFRQPYVDAARNRVQAVNLVYMCLVCLGGLVILFWEDPYIPQSEVDFMMGFLNGSTIFVVTVLALSVVHAKGLKLYRKFVLKEEDPADKKEPAAKGLWGDVELSGGMTSNPMLGRATVPAASVPPPPALLPPPPPPPGPVPEHAELAPAFARRASAATVAARMAKRGGGPRRASHAVRRASGAAVPVSRAALRRSIAGGAVLSAAARERAATGGPVFQNDIIAPLGKAAVQARLAAGEALTPEAQARAVAGGAVYPEDFVDGSRTIVGKAQLRERMAAGATLSPEAGARAAAGGPVYEDDLVTRPVVSKAQLRERMAAGATLSPEAGARAAAGGPVYEDDLVAAVDSSRTVISKAQLRERMAAGATLKPEAEARAVAGGPVYEDDLVDHEAAGI